MALCNGHNEKSFEFHHGAPVMAESNLATDSFGRRLVEEGHIKRSDLARLESYTEQKKCNEASALLMLKLVAPKDLLGLLKEQTRRLIHEAFDWPSGQIESASTPAVAASIFRSNIDTPLRRTSKATPVLLTEVAPAPSVESTMSSLLTTTFSA